MCVKKSSPAELGQPKQGPTLYRMRPECMTNDLKSRRNLGDAGGTFFLGTKIGAKRGTKRIFIQITSLQAR